MALSRRALSQLQSVLPNPYAVEYGRFSSGLVSDSNAPRATSGRYRVNNLDPRSGPNRDNRSLLCAKCSLDGSVARLQSRWYRLPGRRLHTREIFESLGRAGARWSDLVRKGVGWLLETYPEAW